MFIRQQIQKQTESLKSSEMYLSIDIKYVGVITKGSTYATYCGKSVHLWGHGSMNSKPDLLKYFVSVSGVQKKKAN